MIIKPKIRGFICTSAHPAGCAENVRLMAQYAKSHSGSIAGTRNALIIGSSAGYGLASRVAAAFCYGAATVGVCLEKPGTGSRTGTAGWYNNAAFESLAQEAGLFAESVIGDAFSDAVKDDTIRLIKNKLPSGQVDLVVYSVAAPRRTNPVTGEVFSSALKPIGKEFNGKTVNAMTGELSEAAVEPATEEEIAGTVAVMGGEDWLRWMNALEEAGVLAPGVVSAAYSYIGPSLTHSIYKNGTIGRAKDDLEQKAAQIDRMLSAYGGRAFVAVNKALVTQASSPIPAVPLYISLLYKVMKRQGTHEGCIEQMVRMLGRVYCDRGEDFTACTDENGRLRMDDWEMAPEIQQNIDSLWDQVNQENLKDIADIEGYRNDFYRIFGFEVPGVDYDADVPSSMI